MKKITLLIEIAVIIIVVVWMATSKEAPQGKTKEKQWVVFAKSEEMMELYLTLLDSTLQPQKIEKVYASTALYQETGLGDTLLDLQILESRQGISTSSHPCKQPLHIVKSRVESLDFDSRFPDLDFFTPLSKVSQIDTFLWSKDKRRVVFFLKEEYSKNRTKEEYEEVLNKISISYAIELKKQVLEKTDNEKCCYELGGERLINNCVELAIEAFPLELYLSK